MVKGDLNSEGGSIYNMTFCPVAEMNKFSKYGYNVEYTCKFTNATRMISV